MVVAVVVAGGGNSGPHLCLPAKRNFLDHLLVLQAPEDRYAPPSQRQEPTGVAVYVRGGGEVVCVGSVCVGSGVGEWPHRFSCRVRVRDVIVMAR